MRKVNVEEKTRKLNEFRINSSNKTFTGAELKEALKEIISKNESLVNLFIKLFPFEAIGCSKIYEMPKLPIHINVVAGIYKNYNDSRNAYNNMRKNTNELTEDSALKLLQSKGYQIRRIKGFDLDRFAKENPALYKKYLVYEIL